MNATATTAPTFTIVIMERRTKRGMMPSLYLAPGVQDGTPDVSGVFAQVETNVRGKVHTLDLSRMPGDDGWGIDARWVGSYPVHCNGFGARYLRVDKADATLAAALDAAAAVLA